MSRDEEKWKGLASLHLACLAWRTWEVRIPPTSISGYRLSHRCCALAGWQYWLQVKAFAKWFPHAASFVAKPLSAKLSDRPGQLVVLQQVFLDLFVNHPLTYFPS
jgi:hypothetical protein